MVIFPSVLRYQRGSDSNKSMRDRRGNKATKIAGANSPEPFRFDASMSKPAGQTAADALSRYEKLIATNPNVERKGATMPYTSLNGHMFSFLTKTGKLALRL